MTTAPTPPTRPAPAPALAGPSRLLSLDAFRGLVIVLMFLVNVGGSDPCFRLDHAWVPEGYRSWMPHMGWNDGRMGNGLADYVFPWFLFIVGAAIPFSLRSGRGRGRPAWAVALLALRRAVVIYLLGTLLWMASIGPRPDDPAATWHGPIDWRVLLHWDILPLIGFGYLVGVLLFLAPAWARWAFVAGVLAFKFVTLKTGVPPELDGWRAALAARRSTHHAINASLGWWGVMITQGMASAAIVVIGGLAGSVLADERLDDRRRARLLGLGGGAAVLAALLWWQLGDLPFSKDYFTPTYILVTTGAATLALLALWLVVDRRRLTTLTFFRVYGTNALFVYVLAELVWKTALLRWQVRTPGGGSSIAIAAIKAHLGAATTPCLGSYLTVALYIGAYWLAAYALHRKGWFVKV